jgi:hypothetical protein
MIQDYFHYDFYPSTVKSLKHVIKLSFPSQFLTDLRHVLSPESMVPLSPSKSSLFYILEDRGEEDRVKIHTFDVFNMIRDA